MKMAVSRRNFLKGSALAGAGLGLAACAPSGSGSSDGGSKTKVLKFGQTNAKLGLDMQKSTSSGSSSVSDNVCEPPLRWTEDNELVPCLFTEIPQPEADGVTYKCTLKEGVKFHDGTTLKASDIKFTFERMFDPATKAKSTYMYDMIVGAKDKLAGKATEVSGITVEDDTHITFKLNNPMATFASNLGINYAQIFPEKACTEAGENWGKGTNFIGTGPYKLVANDDTTLVSFERFDDYHGGKPNLDKLYIEYIDDVNTKMLNFKNGDIDYADLDSQLLAQYQNDAEVSKLITQYTPLGTYFVNINLNSENLKDVRVRQALNLAINRQELVDTVFAGAGVPANGFLNPSIPGYDDSAEVYPYDPEKAKQLLADAGVTELNLKAAVRSNYQKGMVAVQAYWKAIGVNLDVQVLDAGVWASDWAAGNLEVTSLAWFPLYADADNQMYTYFYSENATKKSSFYNNKDVDEWMAKARQITDADERAELYKKANNQISRVDYATIPLFYPKYQFVAKDYVKNAKVGNLIYHLMDLDVDTSKEDYEGNEPA